MILPWMVSVEASFANWREARLGVSDNSEIKGLFSLPKMECKASIFFTYD